MLTYFRRDAYLRIKRAEINDDILPLFFPLFFFFDFPPILFEKSSAWCGLLFFAIFFNWNEEQTEILSSTLAIYYLFKWRRISTASSVKTIRMFTLWPFQLSKLVDLLWIATFRKLKWKFTNDNPRNDRLVYLGSLVLEPDLYNSNA